MGRGIVVPGIKEWSAKGLPVYVPSLELERAATQAGVLESSLSPLGDGQCLRVGRFGVELLHTPGHSPGSTCLRVTDGVPAIATDDSAEDNNTSANASSSEGSAPVDLLLLSGDTVFPGSCGRLDLPGSDPAVMYDSLRRLAALPDNLPIYPGHSYGGESSTIGREKATGFLRNDITRAQWMNSMVR
jgi:glyoxylase-like metal-dependent hydrolase (beta-lactamase superfamily II)